MKRAEFLKLLAFSAMIPRAARSENEPGDGLSRDFRDGMTTLNEVFWVPELGNWLDRPGKDLRGHFEGYINPPWWSCANAVETMTEFMDLTGSTIYDKQLRELHEANVVRGSRLPKVVETLRKQGKWKEEDRVKLARRMKEVERSRIHGREFRNEYLDDSAWWGVAWLAFHERNKDPRYLRTAIEIQRHMAASWQPSGGVSWGEEEDKREPNSITNSLFVVLSARLHRVTKQEEFLVWAKKALAWEREAKLYDGTGVVDRPGHQGDYWTYNQGAYLGGLEALFGTTGDQAYLDEAAAAARTIIEGSGVVRPDGVLYEKLSTDGWDVSLFKGVCARYFGILSRRLHEMKLHPEIAGQIDKLLLANAGAILKLPKKDGLFPFEWHQPARAEIHNFNTQLSALTAISAACGVR
ncbi:glycoside hydrolase family 76 protein [Luteolibacter marinus]|uniref:glycoside hydrolase family 76 protein n=1 Tax=Luteolibacter marinus TaxID=2776705 RepID=UPI0018681D8A|nr:glycoside hydrolase family 76 protein [Luteolibacter marinus]